MYSFLYQHRDVPDYLCGKISFELMVDPYITPSGITYPQTTTTFSPRVNFPLLVNALMQVLWANNESGDTPCNDIMKGYRFEYKFFRDIQNLCLTYSKEGDAPACCTFIGMCYQRTGEGEALKSIVVGSLVHLRDSHPVIDAVARLKDHCNNEWLLLVQVSLYTYACHSTFLVNQMVLYLWTHWTDQITHMCTHMHTNNSGLSLLR